MLGGGVGFSCNAPERLGVVRDAWIEHFDADDIADAFKFDKNIINSIAEYINDDELEELDDYHDDDEY